MKKRLIIDGTTISSKMDGLSQYTLNIVVNMDLDIISGYDVFFLMNRNTCPHSYLKKIIEKGIQIIYVKIPPIGPMRDLKFLLFLIFHRKAEDLFYITSNQWPIFIFRGIYTIHDLVYEQYPEQLGQLSRIKRYYLHFVTRCGLYKSNRIIAVSKFTKLEILHYHPIPDLETKIDVIYEGYEHLMFIKPNMDVEKPFNSYFLYVGSSRGHKNLHRLLLSINMIKKSLPDGWGFVMVGDMSKLTTKEIELIRSINNPKKIIFSTGWIKEEDLSGYFCQASAFVLPSLSEGFGIPVLESFYYGVPLLCSNASALPEVAGDAAIYFDPCCPEDMANKLQMFTKIDENLRSFLINTGKERLALFTWKRAADAILKRLS